MRTWQFTVLVTPEEPSFTSEEDEDGSFTETFIIIEMPVRIEGETLEAARASLEATASAWLPPDVAPGTPWKIREESEIVP